MEGGQVETLPSLNIPCNPVLGVTRSDGRTGSVSLPMTPEKASTPGSMKFPQLAGKRGTKRMGGYGARVCAYGTPNIVQQIFTGQIPSTFFNDMCYGTNKQTAGFFRYKTPTEERTKELWEPKNVSREAARHVIRDIQDARFRKQMNLEKVSAKKQKARFKKMEVARLKESETMSRGLQAYLIKLDKQTPKHVPLKGNKKRKPKPEVKPLYDSEEDI